MTMQQMKAVQLWVTSHLRAWRGRDDRGGLTDETAMIGLLLLAAVAVGTIITTLVINGANSLDLGF